MEKFWTMENILSLITEFQFTEISDECIQAVVDKDYSDFNTVDLNYDYEYEAKLQGLLDELQSWLLRHKNTAGTHIDNLWALMVDKQLSVPGLLVVLTYFMNQAIKAASWRQIGILAARVYVWLLQMPGSRAFRVLHAGVWRNVIEVLRMLTLLEKHTKEKRGSSYGAASQRLSQGSQNGKRSQSSQSVGRSKRARLANIQSQEEEDIEDENEIENNFQLEKSLTQLLKDILKVLHEYSMKEVIHVLEDLASVFIQLSTFDPMNYSGKSNLSNTCSITDMGYIGLHELCSSENGYGNAMISHCLKLLVPCILMSLERPTSATIPKMIITINDNSVKFISALIQQNENILNSLVLLIQQLVYECLDKAEYRLHVAQAVSQLMSLLSVAQYAELTQWLSKYPGHSSTVCHRVVTVELFSLLLQRKGDLRDLGSHTTQFLLQLIVTHCSDIAASVRAKALSCLGVILSSQVESIQEAVYQLVTTVVVDKALGQGADDRPDESIIGEEESEGTFISMMVQRVRDEKPNVRKAALQVLEALARHQHSKDIDKLFGVLSECCRDSSLFVRKQSIISLAKLVHQVESPGVYRAFLDGVLPQILDHESSIQEKASELLHETVLQPIANYNKNMTSEELLPWHLLTIIANSAGSKLRRSFSKACESWNKAGHINARLIQCLKTHIDTENNQATWMFLAHVIGYVSQVDVHFIVEYWRTFTACQRGTCNDGASQYVLLVLERVAMHVSDQERKLIREQLIRNLLEVTLSLEQIQMACRILYQLFAKSDDWCNDILNKCVTYLKSINTVDVDEDQLICQFMVLQELVILCPQKTKDLHKIVLPILLPSYTDSEAGTEDSPLSQGSQKFVSQFSCGRYSHRVHALALVVLGKMCLLNEILAKRLLPAMAKEMISSRSEAVRNNVVIIMSDLAIGFASMVEPYVSKLASRLRDASALVRQQTLTVLTTLLQEEYVKWKGCLFFRYITTVVDDHPSVAEFAEYCLMHVWPKRFPKLYFENFVECVFHFNCYEGHKVFNRFPQSDTDKRLFSLQSPQNKRKRYKIYKFMLEQLSDEQRFNVSKRLCHEVLSAIAEDCLPYNASSCEVLGDSLSILTCKEIKLVSLHSATDADEPSNEQEVVQAVLAAAKKTIISEAMKMTLMEVVAPTVIKLKHKLEEHQSPLLPKVMAYLQELMKDYKTEMNEILAGNTQLRQEIEYDLNKHEKHKKDNSVKRHPQRSLLNMSASTSPSVRANTGAALIAPASSWSNITTGADLHIPAPPRNKTLVAQALFNSARQVEIGINITKGSRSQETSSRIKDHTRQTPDDSNDLLLKSPVCQQDSVLDARSPLSLQSLRDSLSSVTSPAIQEPMDTSYQSADSPGSPLLQR